MSKPRKWMRRDFVNSKAFQTWKAKGTPNALPWERGGFRSDYEYRKARKEYKDYVKHVRPVPQPTELRKAVSSIRTSKKHGRIDKSLMVPRKASGKSKMWTYHCRVNFTDGTHKMVSVQAPTKLTVRQITRMVLQRIKDSEIWRAYYGAKSDSEEFASKEIDYIEITGVVLPAA